MRGYGNNVLVPVRKNFIAPYDGGIEVSGETVDLKVEGRNYKAIVRENLVPDSVVELEIRGLKSLQIEEGRYLLLVAGIVVVGSLALILLAKRFRWID